MKSVLFYIIFDILINNLYDVFVRIVVFVIISYGMKIHIISLFLKRTEDYINLDYYCFYLFSVNERMNQNCLIIFTNNHLAL